MKIQTYSPLEIEKRSFEIITEILGEKPLDPEVAPIIKRVIHTSADFDFADTMVFTHQAASTLIAALHCGVDIVTDTQMAKAGINKSLLGRWGGTVHCFMSDADVAEHAKARDMTRAAVSMEKACSLPKPVIFVIGNAPTALIRLRELIDQGQIQPVGIIGVPVGFVNVVESKELILESRVPCIVARGRKGGSTIAAAICNALLLMADGKETN